jgi:MFS family permease
MAIGIVLLCMAYVLSQFFRSFLAVMTVVLTQDIGVTSDDLALASGLWFSSFSLMQIPVGGALDKIGPRMTAAILFLIGGAGGAIVFALATAPWHISIAMLLIGIGCSPVLMASYYIFARIYSPKVFATLASVMIGVGSIGNLAGSQPLSMLIDAVGWRATMGGLAIATAFISAGVLALVKNPPAVVAQQKGGFLDLLKIRALWFIIPLMIVQYAPAAGMRGLWIGPYLRDVFDAAQSQIGTASLIMSLAMIAGTFAYGPMDRIFGTRKWVIIAGNTGSFVAVTTLWMAGHTDYWVAVAAFAAVGFFGMSYPMMVAHGRSFAPAHLTGRGVTLMNLFAIGGAGVYQVITGQLQKSAMAQGAVGGALYETMLLFYMVTLAIAIIIYARSQDRLD